MCIPTSDFTILTDPCQDRRQLNVTEFRGLYQGSEMELLPVLIFPLLLVVAAACDVTTMTIPNWISGTLVVSFLALGVVWGLPLGQLGLALGVGTGFLLLGMMAFALGWLGGGDAKLIAAASVWFGWPTAFAFIVYVMVFGGVVTLLLLMFRRTPLPEPVLEVAWVGRLHRANEALPYGVAIAAGGLMAMTQSPLMFHMAG